MRIAPCDPLVQHQYVIIEMVTGTAMARATPTILTTIEMISLVVNPGIVLVVHG